MKNIASTYKKLALSWTACACVAMSLGLTACGGGGGGDVAVTPPPPVVIDPALTLASLQGRWTTASGDLAMRWVPPAQGQTSATLWGLSSDGNYLSVLSANVSGSAGVTAKGKRYNLNAVAGQTNPPIALDLSGTANVKSAPHTISFTGNSILNLQDPLKDGALQLNAVGQWHSNLGLTTLTFKVDALGVITGTSQTGCTYVGVLNARNDVSVYEAKLTETCASTLVEQFTGIGVLSSSATANLNQLTLAMVSADSLTGKVLYFQRQ